MEATAPRDIVDWDKPGHAPVEITFHACEACGYDKDGIAISKSYFFATINGTELGYCGHHATKYEVGLLAKASKVRDLRYLIAP